MKNAMSYVCYLNCTLFANMFTMFWCIEEIVFAILMFVIITFIIVLSIGIYAILIQFNVPLLTKRNV